MNKKSSERKSAGLKSNNASSASILNASNPKNESDDNACVVCFKNVDIYSIGECDHPVCYECSTRMRVLCQQNECPICRQVLSKVIFTYDKLPYRELEAKNRSEYYSKKYKIGFYNNKIQQAFFDLLDHQCPKCDTFPYRSFNGLKSHVRKEHDLYYCDICTEHLKIFTFERRCYTQSELGLHRVKGDMDNKSHRGHPLCEYCNLRYLDRDELFRHLRRDHYFCHFCDADGFNDFYKDYEALAAHFRQDHFLCEEGKCATEQFTGAFRSEIDYKAHVANVHGKSLNKQQVKQARTLQLEITLGRRGRSGQNEQNVANVRSRGDEETIEYDLPVSQSQSNQRSLTIDAQNERDFPSLGASSGHSVSVLRPSSISVRNHGRAGLARTKENFPALGGGGVKGTSNASTALRPTDSLSNVLKKSPHQSTSAKGAVARSTNTVGSTKNANSNSTGMIIHVSNRPVSNNAQTSSALDFPALPAGKLKKNNPIRNNNELALHTLNYSQNISAKNNTQIDENAQLPNSNSLNLHGKLKIKNGMAFNRQLDDDFLSSNSDIPLENVSAKHRTLVDDYVSVANPNTFQKIQLVQKEEQEAKLKKNLMTDSNMPKLTALDFPTLGASSIVNNGVCNKTNLWVKKPFDDKTQREVDKSKAKGVSASKQLMDALFNNNAVESAATGGATAKKDKKIKHKKQNVQITACDTLSKTSKNVEEKNNYKNNENKSADINSNKISNIQKLDNSNSMSSKGLPPGFSNEMAKNEARTMKSSPVFPSNIVVNSVAKSPNNLTFTSSLGESYHIVSSHSFIQPPESVTRNQMLVSYFKEILPSNEALEEFREISQEFRRGIYKAPAYYEHCQAALKDKFDKIFPELLALLPDITKQQELFLVHSQHLKSLPIEQRKKSQTLEVCSICKQVMLRSDAESHKGMHSLKINFPELSSTLAPIKSSAGKSK